MGISWGDTMVRASRSPTHHERGAEQHARRGAPGGGRSPTISRTMWGTTRPTNPITPLTATATPTMSEVTTNRLRRRRRTSTPSEAAGSAPMARALRARPGPAGSPWRATSASAGIGSWGQLALPNEPSSQNRTDWVACGLPRKIRKLVDRLEERGEHHPAQDELGRAPAGGPAGDEEHRGHRRQRPEHAADRDGPDAQRGERPEQQDGGGAHAGPGGDAEQERIGQGVAHQRPARRCPRWSGRRPRRRPAAPGAGGSATRSRRRPCVVGWPVR